MDELKKPYAVIRFNTSTGQLERPTFLLKTRTGHIIGKLKYTDLNMSLVGKGVDEITFTVHKVVNGEVCDFWEKIQDTAIVEFVEYNHSQFEAEIRISDEEETVKSFTLKSLECELGQRILYEFHVNDEDAIIYSEGTTFTPTVLYNENDPDHSLINRALKEKAPHWSVGEVSPYFNVNGRVYECSKLQREFTVDGTSIYDFFDNDVSEECGCVFIYDTKDRLVNCYNLESCVFLISSMEAQQGYTYVNGVFYDDQGNVLQNQSLYGWCNGIGEDTNIILSKAKLSRSFIRESDAGAIKNCFRVTGGDDIITNFVGAANVTGNNYIYLFGNFQYEDMGTDLANAIRNYQQYYEQQQAEFVKDGGVYIYQPTYTYDSERDCCIDAKNHIVPDAIHRGNKVYTVDTCAYYKNSKCYSRDDVELTQPTQAVYVAPGMFTDFCHTSDRLSYLEHSKFPNVDVLSPTTASEQKSIIQAYFENNNVLVKYGYNPNTDSDFTSITATIETMLKLECDPRYKVTIVEDRDNITTCSLIDYTHIGTWTATIRIVKDTNPEDAVADFRLSVNVELIDENVTIDKLAYCKQKVLIAINKMNLKELGFAVSDPQTGEITVISDSDLRTLLNQYNLTSLKTFMDGFSSCRSTLDDLYNNLEIEAYEDDGHGGKREKDIISQSLIISRDAYTRRYNIACEIYDYRNQQVEEWTKLKESQDKAMTDFKESMSFENWLINEYGSTLGGQHWLDYNKYIREDEYNNGNYVSDGLTDSEILAKAKELLDVATSELSKACNAQYTISGNLNNMFAEDELKRLHSKFALFNYVRAKVDDKIYKLRLVEIRFNESSPDQLDVTFSEQIQDVTGYINDTASILAKSESMSTTYSSTTKQAKQGVNAYNTFDTIRAEGMDSSKYLIKNSPEQLMTFERNGLLGRSMFDEGIYSDEQSILTSNGLYFTTDNWDTVNTALGKFMYNGSWKYGLNAEYVIGKFIVGQNLSIINNSNSVEITGNGIVLDGGTITWKDGHKLQESDVTNLTTDLSNINTTLSTYNTNFTTFQKQVQGALTGNPVTEIGSDYVISPMIGGGYLYIKNPNDGRSVTIDPQHNMWDLGAYASRTVLKCYGNPADTYDPNQQGSNSYALDISNGKIYRNSMVSATSWGWVYQETLSKSNDYIFKITNTNGNVTIGADSDGNATFSGSITVGDTPSASTTGFTVNSSGLLKASNAEIYGTIYANSGTFSGNLNAAGGTFSGNLTSSSIYLNNNSTTNRGAIILNDLTENDNVTYKSLSINNDYASNSDNLSISFGFKNVDTTNYAYTSGFSIVKKNGSIYNKLYVNTYLYGNFYLNNYNINLGSKNTTITELSDGGMFCSSHGVFGGNIIAGGTNWGGGALTVNGNGTITGSLGISGNLSVAGTGVIKQEFPDGAPHTIRLGWNGSNLVAYVDNETFKVSMTRIS